MELISIKRKSPTNDFVSDLLDCLNGYTPFTFYAANDQCVKQGMNQLGFQNLLKRAIPFLFHTKLGLASMTISSGLIGNKNSC
jgi:hypothetical protein